MPGHERFVRTMVAGATGIDLFLLVVDAGEGPKPQTTSTSRSSGCSAIEQGVVALTKIDAVEPSDRGARERSVRELLPGPRSSPSARSTGTGLPELSPHSRERPPPSTPRHEGPARLYVDRSSACRGRAGGHRHAPLGDDRHG